MSWRQITRQNEKNYKVNRMTKTVKIILISALSAGLIALVLYCVRFGKAPEEKPAENGSVSAEDALQTAQQLSAAAETALQNGTAKHITLSDDGSSASVSGVQIHGNTVTITLSGVYSVSGTLTEGQLAVDCDDTVVLILDGTKITHSADAAIYISNADHTLIYLPEGSSNKLVSGTEQEITAASENTDVKSASGATLYAKDSLSIAGSGKLDVSGYIHNAVATTDHLIVLGGELELAAVNNGLKGKDSVTILDGKITIHSGNDGIQSDNDVDADCGNIDIRGGEIHIVSLGDGMQAEHDLSVEDGILTISAGNTAALTSGKSVQSFETPPGDMRGGTEAAPLPRAGKTPPDVPNGTEQGSFPGSGSGIEFPDKPGEMNAPWGETPFELPQDHGGRTYGGFENQTDPFGNMRGRGSMGGDSSDRLDRERSYGSDSETGTKGLKSSGNITVSGGSITITSTDDGIHANGSITVTGGTFRLSTDDDGFHADDTLTVSDGDITVLQSYEGLEGHLIYINGGTISVTASDDGINANGGDSAGFGRMPVQTNTGSSSLPVLKISGGTLYVNADGDGLDSNGDLIVEGGNIIVDGPANGGNGALDYGSENGGSIICRGGTILAIGASGMAESFGNDSLQCSFMHNFSGTMAAGAQIAITDENGKIISEHRSAKAFNSIVFSSPELVLGSTCTIHVGDQIETITIESISNVNASVFNTPEAFSRNGRQ